MAIQYFSSAGWQAVWQQSTFSYYPYLLWQLLMVFPGMCATAQHKSPSEGGILRRRLVAKNPRYSAHISTQFTALITHVAFTRGLTTS